MAKLRDETVDEHERGYEPEEIVADSEEDARKVLERRAREGKPGNQYLFKVIRDMITFMATMKAGERLDITVGDSRGRGVILQKPTYAVRRT